MVNTGAKHDLEEYKEQQRSNLESINSKLEHFVTEDLFRGLSDKLEGAMKEIESLKNDLKEANDPVFFH